MMNNMLYFLYGISVAILFWQAVRVMSKGFQTKEANKKETKDFADSSNDRTGQITIHPEILNQDGDITDEDLLTVRFSRDADPPKST